MVNNYITANDLATILDTYKSTVYYTMHPSKKHKIASIKALKENRKLGNKICIQNYTNYLKNNKNILINIDELINKHKVSKNFKFKGSSFLERMKYTIDINSFPEYLSTKQVKIITGFSNYKIIKLRNDNSIKFVNFVDENYPINSKGRTQFLYYKESLMEYLKNNNITINDNTKIKISKQFYSPKEVQEYLESQYNIKKSLSTIYRRILITKEIPAIRFGYMLKIPILEFKELDLKKIFL